MSAHAGPALARADGHAVIDCTACGFAHLDPIPTEAELAAFYARQYYDRYYAGMLAKYREEAAFWALEHADRLDDWEALLGGTGGLLVDVGCGGGTLLERARERGWRTLGIDPADDAVAECRRLGLDVVQGSYADVALPPDGADVVHARFLLEHVADPRRFLDWARDAVRPGGIVCVHVPNDFSPLQLSARDTLGKRSWWVAVPDHVNYFTFASLRRLLAAAGLEEAGRDATYPMEWFLLMGEDYVDDDAAGAAAHAKRMRLELALEAAGQRRPLHAHLAAQGAGREAVIHAVKARPGPSSPASRR